jgi:hypothetical protein
VVTGFVVVVGANVVVGASVTVSTGATTCTFVDGRATVEVFVVVVGAVVTALDCVVVSWLLAASSDDLSVEVATPITTRSTTTAPAIHGHFLGLDLPGSGAACGSEMYPDGVGPVAGG